MVQTPPVPRIATHPCAFDLLFKIIKPIISNENKRYIYNILITDTAGIVLKNLTRNSVRNNYYKTKASGGRSGEELNCFVILVFLK